ncbi:MAG TPA: flagellar export chaperone FliS [Candidatus Dormibacteraeota bacterium]|nr:flagellar export chaperone FliS [Candidatus Dormibacteraeota bacterium]
MKSSSRDAQYKYLETSILSSSREELIVKCMDIAILFAKKGLDKIRSGGDSYATMDIHGISDSLQRSQQALTVLMGSLNFEIGGEVARNLFRLYEWWHHELVMANMEKQGDRIETILPHMVTMRETWAEAVRKFRAERRQQPGSMVAGLSA